ncbi:MAG: agarase [Candidatus Limnocylindrales bacterium]
MRSLWSWCLWWLVVASLVLSPAGVDAAEVFFRVRQVDGTWWLIDPDGHRFVSKGVDTVQFAQDRIKGSDVSPYAETCRAQYGSVEAWRQAVARRLIGWGFNSLGAWSDERLSTIEVDGKHLAYAPTIDLGAAFVARNTRGRDAWLHGTFPDVFDPEFETTVRQVALQRCAPRKDDRWLIGWFTDNELRWGPDWRGHDELLTLFLALPPGAPGRAAAVALLRERHAEIARFNDVWKTLYADWGELARGGPVKPPVTRPAVYAQNEAEERRANEADPRRAAFVADCNAFLAALAERYFRITCVAVRSADPNHIVFGCRFAYVPPKPVVAAAAKYLDAISFNCYENDPLRVINAYSVFGKPLIIGEFAFRGADSGMPNTRGAGPVVKTQGDRAAAFERYVRSALSHPNVIGYHWFEHADEPKEGRFDGEDSNYGIVNIRDEPYEVLLATMSRVHAEAEELHRNASR